MKKAQRLKKGLEGKRDMKNGEVDRKKSRFEILSFIFQQAAKKRNTEKLSLDFLANNE